MDACSRNRKRLAVKFKDCQKAILAIGDETRQRIFLALLENDKVGMRVGEITAQTNLSRPAVSHHLRILKEAGIVSVRRKGTMNFYYISADEAEWGKLADLVEKIEAIIKKASSSGYPDRFLGQEE